MKMLNPAVVVGVYNMNNRNYDIHITRTERFCYLTAISSKTNNHIGKACIDLDSEDANRYRTLNNKRAVKVILVWTAESYCNQGIGTALLNKIIELFNDDVIYLNVIPVRNTKFDKDKNGLIEFYSKFGFKRYDKDTCVTTMTRTK